MAGMAGIACEPQMVDPSFEAPKLGFSTLARSEQAASMNPALRLLAPKPTASSFDHEPTPNPTASSFDHEPIPHKNAHNIPVEISTVLKLSKPRKIGYKACKKCCDAKVKCEGDGNEPCARCKKRGLDCVYEARKLRAPPQDSTPSSSKQSAPTPAERKGRGCGHKLVDLIEKDGEQWLGKKCLDCPTINAAIIWRPPHTFPPDTRQTLSVHEDMLRTTCYHKRV
jgi:hypothetical protein